MKGLRTTMITAMALGLVAGSTSSVAAQEQPVEISGQVTFSGSVETWATDDARLTGLGTWDPTEGSPLEPAPAYFLNGRSLTTDEGTWRQLPVPTVNIPHKADQPAFDMVLIGEDEYEGLVFVAQATWTGVCPGACEGFEVRGYIRQPVYYGRALDQVCSKLYAALNEGGIEIPFPQRVVHMSASAEGAS